MTTTATTTTTESAPAAPTLSNIAPEKKKYVREEKQEETKVEKEPVPVNFDVSLHRQDVATITNLRLMATCVADKKRLARTVVGFDLDRTLKYSSLLENAPLKPGQTTALPLIKVRGGDEFIKTLDHLREHGATMFVLTARGPSAVKHQTVTQELARLDLLKYFEDQIKPQTIVVDGDSKVYVGNGVLVCSYYKPHAFLNYLEMRNLKPHRILFVDDFVVNVASFCDHLKLNADHSQLTTLKSYEGIWLDPQAIINSGDMGASNSENSYDGQFTQYRKMFKGLKKSMEPDPAQIKMNKLHHSVRYNAKVKDIKLLLEDPDIDIDGVDKYGRTPLTSACKRGATELAELLLGMKAQIDVQCERGNSAVMYAAMGGHEKTCDLLIAAKANLTLENKFYRRADILAGKQGHPELAEKLVNAGVYADLK